MPAEWQAVRHCRRFVFRLEPEHCDDRTESLFRSDWAIGGKAVDYRRTDEVSRPDRPGAVQQKLRACLPRKFYVTMDLRELLARS